MEPTARGEWAPRRYFAFATREVIDGQHQQGPAATRKCLQRRAAGQTTGLQKDSLGEVWP